MPLSSYNGWRASPDPQALNIQPCHAAGTNVAFPPGLRAGAVTTVLMWVAGQFHRRVEPLGEGCWGYAYRQNRNADNLSCHASGTAIDINAPKHPNGARNTFSRRQVDEIHEILAEVEGVVRWGGDFTGTVDAMHFEISGAADDVKRVADRLARPATTHTQGDGDMTPDQAKQLGEVHQMLTALVAPRRTDHADTDPKHISLGDVLTQEEKTP